MQKTVTIKTLADKLNLSVSAVSKALNDYPDISQETKAMVCEEANRLGYSPNLMARSLAKKTSNFIGVVIRDVTSIYGEFFKALNKVARKHGLNLILYDTNYDPEVEKSCIQNLIDTMALGIIIAPSADDVSEICSMTEGRMPVVFLGGKVTAETVNYVCSDSAAGAEIALQHLIGLGHEKIALLCDHKKSASRGRIIDTYKQMMKKIGEKPRIFYEKDRDPAQIKTGYRLAKRMLASEMDITAVFAVKDVLAFGAIQAFSELGLQVPADISVIGYDGTDAAALPMIELTTVAQPRAAIAGKIIEILLQHVEHPELEPEHFLIRPELIIRKSTIKRDRDRTS